MKIRIINKVARSISLPGPLPRLNINDDIVINIDPISWDTYRDNINDLILNNIINVLLVELGNDSGSRYTLYNNGDRIHHPTESINAINRVHYPIVSPSRSRVQGGTAPSSGASGNLVYLEMTVDTDEAFRIIKIPDSFVGGPEFYVHWTKSQDTDQSGKTVKWRVDYNVFNGDNEDASSTDNFIEFSGVYEDTGTTNRVVYNTGGKDVIGIYAGAYVSIRVRAITPDSGVELANPAFVALDIRLDKYTNRD